MPNFLFVFHGGKMPDTPEEGAREMEAWQQWYADMGQAVVDGGAPVGKSKTVTAQGVADDGGSNPASGYAIVSADTIEAAVELAKGCPILKHGSVEVAGCIDM